MLNRVLVVVPAPDKPTGQDHIVVVRPSCEPLSHAFIHSDFETPDVRVVVVFNGGIDHASIYIVVGDIASLIGDILIVSGQMNEHRIEQIVVVPQFISDGSFPLCARVSQIGYLAPENSSGRHSNALFWVCCRSDRS